jgi:hypothetical protein
MELTLSQTEWALGLFQYSSIKPVPSLFAEFYELVVNLLEELNAPATYIAAEGDGYLGESVKFGGTVNNRLIKSAFEGVSVLSIVTNPKGSKEPSYDRYVSASLSFNAPSELLLCICMNDSVLPFSGERFRRLILDLLYWKQWSFGFGLDDLVVRQPDFHVLSLDNGNLSKEERKSLTVWYNAKAEERQRKLRGVYPVVILNKKQLQQPVSASQSLCDFIKSNPAFRVENVGDLTVWEIPTSEIDVTKERLQNCPALIA